VVKKIETKTDSSGTIVVTPQEKVKAWMQVIVSFILLGAGILILVDPRWLPRADESLKKIAAGWIGAVIGYWFS
jgi:hypothetical protein